ncbi:hypothetical protein ACP4OV_007875 [Aristida adscensionis]
MGPFVSEDLSGPEAHADAAHVRRRGLAAALSVSFRRPLSDEITRRRKSKTLELVTTQRRDIAAPPLEIPSPRPSFSFSARFSNGWERRADELREGAGICLGWRRRRWSTGLIFSIGLHRLVLTSVLREAQLDKKVNYILSISMEPLLAARNSFWYKEAELNMGENSCIDRCVSKYWQVTNLVGQLLGNRPQM